MKRVFIIHGWGGNPNIGWLKWIGQKLKNKGYEVYAPEMPDKDYPRIKEWVDFLSNLVGKADNETYFIGHSIGCQAIMRYLQELKEEAGKAVFIAGWINLKNLETKEEKEIAEPWLNTKIEFDKIKRNCKKIIEILSDNDEWVPVSDGNIFKEKLNAKVIIEKGRGHYIESEINEIPVLLNEFLK